MKTKIITIVALFCAFAASAFSGETIFIHKTDLQTLGAPASKTDSIWFSDDSQVMFISINGGANTAQYAVSAVDSVTFGANGDTVFVTWAANGVSVINPLAFEGVTVNVDNDYVTVVSTNEDIKVTYVLAGNTSEGNFKLYSPKKYNLILNSVNITNPVGPAINLQSKKNADIILAAGTENFLYDGKTYSDAPKDTAGEAEDQKAAFFAEGDMQFKGTGTLTVAAVGTAAHAIASDDGIEIKDCSIIIKSSAKDAIHGKGGIEISGGTVTTSQTSDALDGDEGFINISGGTLTLNATSADSKGMTADSIITISGGTITINASGDESKGIKSDMDISITGGTVNINTSGNAVTTAVGSGVKPSYCTGIKTDKNVSVENAAVTIKATGKGNKGISADGNISILSGSVVNINCSGDGASYTDSTGTLDAYRSTCLTADGTINLYDGTTTLTNSGSAGMGIKSTKKIIIGSTETTPTVNVTTTGAEITLGTSGSGGWGPGGGHGGPGGDNSTDAAEAKAVKGDSLVHIISGIITISSADDGIKTADSILIDGGTLKITKCYEGLEGPRIDINGGYVSIVASDDATNATYGNGGESDDGSILRVTGGKLVLQSSAGDCMDSNGSAYISGGTVIIHGAASNVEVAADVNGTFQITGGFFIATGAYNNMSQNFNKATQNSAMFHVSSSLSASTLFRIQDADGNDIVTFQPRNNYSYILFSSPSFVNGTYSVYMGGTCTGTSNDGLYEGGTYSGGTLKKTITISAKTNNISL